MTFKDRRKSCDDSDTVNDDEVQGSAEKHVRIAEQNLTLMYYPKSYSMPDLLQMDTFKDSYHKHPCVKLSTTATNSNIDIKSYLPKKQLNIKKKISNGLKHFRNRSTIERPKYADIFSSTRERSKPSDIVSTEKWKSSDQFQKEKSNGPPPSQPENISKKHDDKLRHNKLLQPFKNLNIFNSHKSFRLRRLKSSSSYFKETKCRSDSNLAYCASEDVKLLSDKPFALGLQRIHTYRKSRSFSEDHTYRIKKDVSNENNYGGSVFYEIRDNDENSEKGIDKDNYGGSVFYEIRDNDENSEKEIGIFLNGSNGEGDKLL